MAPYVRADTTSRVMAPERIADELLHPLIDSEIQRVPDRYGITLLYNAEGTVIHVADGMMLGEVLMAKQRFPETTDFSLILNCNDYRSTGQLVENLRKKFGLDRKQIGFR
jgi:hypothetical protein